jgi:hypothetical protein
MFWMDASDGYPLGHQVLGGTRGVPARLDLRRLPPRFSYLAQPLRMAGRASAASRVVPASIQAT